MAVWQSSLLSVVRVLVGDSSGTTFDDATLIKAIVVGGLLASQEHDLATTYTFDLENFDITPDPADAASFDQAAIALFTLKAACLVSQNRAQTNALTAIRIKDGDTEVDTRAAGELSTAILKVGPCQAYDKMLREQKILRGTSLGAAVISPGSHVDALTFSPQGFALSMIEEFNRSERN